MSSLATAATAAPLDNALFGISRLVRSRRLNLAPGHPRPAARAAALHGTARAHPHAAQPATRMSLKEISHG